MHSTIPGDAIVIRGGSNTPHQIERSFIPSDQLSKPASLAAVCATDATMKDVCSRIPHENIRCMTVSDVRAAGGDVIPDKDGSPNQVRIVGLQSGNVPLAGCDATISDPFRHLCGNLSPPRVFVDYMNADQMGRVRLNTVGTLDDLALQGVALHEGLLLQLYDYELLAEGTARFDSIEGWVAEIDWDAFSIIL